MVGTVERRGLHHGEREAWGLLGACGQGRWFEPRGGRARLLCPSGSGLVPGPPVYGLCPSAGVKGWVLAMLLEKSRCPPVFSPLWPGLGAGASYVVKSWACPGRGPSCLQKSFLTPPISWDLTGQGSVWAPASSSWAAPGSCGRSSRCQGQHEGLR